MPAPEPGGDVRFKQNAYPYVVYAVIAGAYVAWRWVLEGHPTFVVLILAWLVWAILRAQATEYRLTDTSLELVRPWGTRRITYDTITRVERQRTLFGGPSILVQTGAGGFGGVFRISYVPDTDTVFPVLERRVSEAP